MTKNINAITTTEFDHFMNKKIRVTGLDGKSRKAKLVEVYQYSIMLETNINTKEKTITGYMLYMKHAIKSVSEVPE